jgi:hypothetical protein
VVLFFVASRISGRRSRSAAVQEAAEPEEK